MTELSRPRGDHVGSIGEFLELRLEHITSADFFLLIFPDGQGRDELLASSTVDEEEILLTDLHTQLFLRVIKLADSTTFRESAQSELGRM